MQQTRPEMVLDYSTLAVAAAVAAAAAAAARQAPPTRN
jgi:hypothetical protein